MKCKCFAQASVSWCSVKFPNLESLKRVYNTAHLVKYYYYTNHFRVSKHLILILYLSYTYLILILYLSYTYLILIVFNKKTLLIIFLNSRKLRRVEFFLETLDIRIDQIYFFQGTFSNFLTSIFLKPDVAFISINFVRSKSLILKYQRLQRCVVIKFLLFEGERGGVVFLQT